MVPSTTSRDKADVVKSEDESASGSGMRDNRNKYNMMGTMHRIVRVNMERLRDASLTDSQHESRLEELDQRTRTR